MITRLHLQKNKPRVFAFLHRHLGCVMVQEGIKKLKS